MRRDGFVRTWLGRNPHRCGWHRGCVTIDPFSVKPVMTDAPLRATTPTVDGVAKSASMIEKRAKAPRGYCANGTAF